MNRPAAAASSSLRRDRDHPYARVAGDLAGSPFAAVTYVDETASTNADAAALLGAESHFGRSIVAERQTHGSGRKGRAWIAAPGTSLLVTTILPRAIDAGALWAVPFWTALAVRQALLRQGVATSLHWPNDLLIDRGKVAGILCTSRITGETAWVACGVGINVHRLHGAERGIDPPPAFCDDVAPIERGALLLALLREYAATLDDLATPARVARSWESAAWLPGVAYRIVKDGENAPFGATALRIADGGGLVVKRDDDGREETIALADARALR
jgi:BirA family biotin operon repressor/biotin-[acetyl-CoA-carboxylase] ligase